MAQMFIPKCFIGFLCVLFPVRSEDAKGKALSVFNIVTFPNSGCAGNNGKNGTCYTTVECRQKEGEAAGSCAEGYGVCCVITLSCGRTSSDNCTYLEETAFMRPSSLSKNPCWYKVCRNNADICRIRLDFETFVLSSPVTGTVVAKANNNNAVKTTGNALGDCVVDTFTYSSPGNPGAPVICGSNTGQHMILEASETCNMINFNIGDDVMPRSWKIKATQYDCGDEDDGGSPGCLQYFTGSTGVISSFNYDTSSKAVSLMAQHLSSQYYTICIRREINACSICYSPISDSMDKKNPSFGLSMSSNANIKSGVDTYCVTDYLFIANGVKKNEDIVKDGSQKFCGPIFALTPSVTSTTVCSFVDPFRITLRTDEDEITGDNADATKSELIGPPGGTVGFSLFYEQITCKN